ncbi:MAG: hypothetical protein HQL21_05860 [Candidatus Omnitrophica bacterium]|nr:hypothetical protein [Candidatus Omnitrophota bacterium]
MEERFFKYAILVSLLLHAVLFCRIYLSEEKVVVDDKKSEVSYQLEKPKAKAPENFIEKVMAFQERPMATLSAPAVPQPAISDAFLQQNLGMGDQFKMYERTPEKVKGLKVTKEVSVPMLKSEKINTPSYVTYYQIVRDRIRDRAYINYTKLSVGEVYLTFVIKADGELSDLQIMESKSQGNEFLRDVGLRSVKEAGPFPPFPKDLTYPELTFNVQISFQFREGE